MMSRISSDEGHCLWLQGLFNLLTNERKAKKYCSNTSMYFGDIQCIKYRVALIGFYHKMTYFYNLCIEFG